MKTIGLCKATEEGKIAWDGDILGEKVLSCNLAYPNKCSVNFMQCAQSYIGVLL